MLVVRPSRLVLSATAVTTMVGSAVADLTSTHVFNPQWPGHARFHEVAGWGTVTGGQLLALWLLWRPRSSPAEVDLAVRTAALLPVIAWTPLFLALATPGTAIGDDPSTCRRWPACRPGHRRHRVPRALGHALHRGGR